MAVLRPTKPLETVRLMRQHWQQAAKGDFSQAEIDKAKAYLTGSYGYALPVLLKLPAI